MGGTPNGGFGHDSFPPISEPGNEETGMDELYPERLQDTTNDLYHNNKVLPRKAGVDYIKGPLTGLDSPESKSTFPHKY